MNYIDYCYSTTFRFLWNKKGGKVLKFYWFKRMKEQWLNSDWKLFLQWKYDHRQIFWSWEILRLDWWYNIFSVTTYEWLIVKI